MKEFKMHFGRGTGSINLESDVFEDFVQTFNLPVFVNTNRTLRESDKLNKYSKLKFTVFQGKEIYCRK